MEGAYSQDRGGLGTYVQDVSFPRARGPWASNGFLGLGLGESRTK